MIILLKMVLESVLLQCCRRVLYYAVVIHYHKDLSVLSPGLAVNRCQVWTLLFSNLTASSCFHLRGLVLAFITSFFKEFPGSGSSLGKNCIIFLHFNPFSMSFFWWHIALLNKDNEQLVPVCYLYATQDFADLYHILPKSPFLPSLENSLLVVPHPDIILCPCCPSVNNSHSTYILSKMRGPKLYKVSRYAVDLFGAVMLTILFPVPFLVPL